MYEPANRVPHVVVTIVPNCMLFSPLIFVNSHLYCNPNILHNFRQHTPNIIWIIRYYVRCRTILLICNMYIGTCSIDRQANAAQRAVGWRVRCLPAPLSDTRKLVFLVRRPRIIVRLALYARGGAQHPSISLLWLMMRAWTTPHCRVQPRYLHVVKWALCSGLVFAVPLRPACLNMAEAHSRQHSNECDIRSGMERKWAVKCSELSGRTGRGAQITCRVDSVWSVPRPVAVGIKLARRRKYQWGIMQAAGLRITLMRFDSRSQVYNPLNTSIVRRRGRRGWGEANVAVQKRAPKIIKTKY